MNITLWVMQALLALEFGYSGATKSLLKRETLVELGQTGVEKLSYPSIRIIGILEILGSIGIVIPWVTGIAIILTPVAAIGFSLIMLFAFPVHYRNAEYKAALFNVITFCIANFVAILRFISL